MKEEEERGNEVETKRGEYEEEEKKGYLIKGRIMQNHAESGGEPVANHAETGWRITQNQGGEPVANNAEPRR